MENYISFIDVLATDDHKDPDALAYSFECVSESD